MSPELNSSQLGRSCCVSGARQFTARPQLPCLRSSTVHSSATAAVSPELNSSQLGRSCCVSGARQFTARPQLPCLRSSTVHSSAAAAVSPELDSSQLGHSCRVCGARQFTARPQLPCLRSPTVYSSAAPQLWRQLLMTLTVSDCLFRHLVLFYSTVLRYCSPLLCNARAALPCGRHALCDKV